MDNISIDMWITIATIIATLIIGQLTKKFTNLKSKQIPLQNITIGIIVCLIEFAITRDINIAVAMSGLISGGTYDLGKAIKQVFGTEEIYAEDLIEETQETEQEIQDEEFENEEG